MTPELERKIKLLPGPVLVLGASGFVGANLFRTLLAAREDVYGTSSKPAPWRLRGLPEDRVLVADLLVEQNLDALVEKLRPRTVLDCVAYGAYSFEQDSALIFRTNVDYVVRLCEALQKAGTARYIHAGSSSEYGEASAGPAEESHLKPNSAYAASKAAAAQYLYYLGKKHAFPCANLRLYSIYGPYEDASRLVPALVEKGLQGAYPPLVDPRVSRDFVYVDDCSEAFIDAAVGLKPEHYGDSFNIGSGVKCTMAEMAAAAKRVFGLASEPAFGGMASRAWDLEDWYASPAKAQQALGWRARTGLEDGLRLTAEWMKGLRDLETYHKASKRFRQDGEHSVSVVLALQDGAAGLPALVARVKAVLERLGLPHELIVVNDGGGDAAEEAIHALSRADRDLLGLTHSRRFGLAAAYRSGMAASTKNAVILLAGDGQDPPELIEQFIEKWKDGFEVVYGRPSQAGLPLLARSAYSLFYKAFDRFSYIRLPRDAGDFGLMDRRVVASLLRFPERDLFIRGLRAFAGFRQCGVDYARERPEGLLRRLLGSLGQAKRGILSFSTAPLSLLSFVGGLLFVFSVLLGLFQFGLKVLVPSSTPSGFTTTLLLITFFGSLNLLGISVLGEYLATIFEEVKRRPHAILRHVVRDGEARSASQSLAALDKEPA